MPKELINKINTEWRPNLAYATGLMASDGHLRSDNKELSIVSKDRELINLFSQAIAFHKEPIRTGRGGTQEKKYWTLRFKSKNFHNFLTNIGITPLKSRTIQKVDVPNKFFADFLRGLYDGDGTFWTWWDKRWPNAFGYTLGFSSASPLFIAWVKQCITDQFSAKGYIHTGKGVLTIRYAKGDSRKLYKTMYYNKNVLYLPRKYNKIKSALAFDDQLRHDKSSI